MKKRKPLPHEIWPDEEERHKHMQAEFDAYDALVAQEQAEIAARQADFPFPDGVPSTEFSQASNLQVRNSNANGADPHGSPTDLNAIRNDPLVSLLESLSTSNDTAPSSDLAQPRVEFTVADALAPPPPLEWCVEGLFACPSVSVLVGDPGSKKTLTVIDLAVCVAMGIPWLDHPVTQGSVLFIDEQTGSRQLLARFNAVLNAHGASDQTPIHIRSLAGHNLRDKGSADELIKIAKSKNARLIIIDAFSNLLRGGSESSLAAVLPTLFHLRRLADACNAAVVLTHHTNRHGSFRGSYAIAAAADLMLSIKSKPDEATIQITPLKSRLLAPKPFTARVNFKTSPDGTEQISFTRTADSPSSPGPDATDPYLRLPPKPAGVVGETFLIYQDVYYHPNSSFLEIRSRNLAWKEGTLRNCIQQLLDEGVFERSNPGAPEARYSIARPP